MMQQLRSKEQVKEAKEKAEKKKALSDTLLEQIDQAKSIADLKVILRQIIAQ